MALNLYISNFDYMSFVTNNFSFKKILLFIIVIFANLSVLSFILRIALHLNLLPEFQPAIDIDRVVITSKIDLSKNLNQPDIIFLGDSSCLMNIDTKFIIQKTKLNAVNLGTLSFLNIDSYKKLLANISSKNKLPKIVCLIVHPELLRKTTFSDSHREVFESYNSKIQVNHNEYFLNDYLSINIFKNRIYSKMPIALNNNSFRDYYGFTTIMKNYIYNNHGSAVDPRKFKLEDNNGNTLYRINNQNLIALKNISVDLPKDVKLCLCLSPVPEELTGNNYADLINSMYNEIEANIENIKIIKAPYTYKGISFSTKTHLSEETRKAYNQIILDLLNITDIAKQ